MKMNNDENMKRLELVLDAYGADPQRWPADERETLVREAKSPEGLALMAEAAGIDAMLNALPQPAMPAGALERMMATVPGRETSAEIVDFSTVRKSGKNQMFREFVPAAVAVAACLVLGVMLGTSQLAEQYLPANMVVASNDTTLQDGSVLDLDDGGFEDGEVL